MDQPHTPRTAPKVSLAITNIKHIYKQSSIYLEQQLSPYILLFKLFLTLRYFWRNSTYSYLSKITTIIFALKIKLKIKNKMEVYCTVNARTMSAS